MCGLSEISVPKNNASSRRRRIWELDERCFCPLVGVCFEIAELHRIVGRMVELPAGVSEYEVHAIAVRLCQTRTPLAEVLQRELEKRYVLTITRFKHAKTGEQLKALWDDARPSAQVRAALWAVWTHPRCDDDLGQHVYTGIHMLQHQLGVGHRHDLLQVQKLEQENLLLACELANVQKRFTEFRDRKTVSIESLQQQLQARELEVQQLTADRQRLVSLVSSEHSPARLLQEMGQLQQKQLETETRLSEQKIRVAVLAREADEMGKEKKWLEEELARALRQPVAASETAPCGVADLAGQCVLCVGGRSGAVDIYRGLVERLGGKFMHHDGGMEENIHRLEANISSADAVICQAGCISHNAYWLVKDLCKRNGKPCIFARKPSVSAFLHGLESLVAKSSGDDKASGIKTIRIVPG